MNVPVMSIPDICEKYFPNNDPDYVSECLEKLMSGQKEGMFKYLVDKSFDLEAAMKIAAFELYRTKKPANELITQELLDDIHLAVMYLTAKQAVEL